MRSYRGSLECGSLLSLLPLCSVAILHRRSLLRPHSLPGCGRPGIRLFAAQNLSCQQAGASQHPPKKWQQAAELQSAAPPITNALPLKDNFVLTPGARLFDNGNGSNVFNTTPFHLPVAFSSGGEPTATGRDACAPALPEPDYTESCWPECPLVCCRSAPETRAVRIAADVF